MKAHWQRFGLESERMKSLCAEYIPRPWPWTGKDGAIHAVFLIRHICVCGSVAGAEGGVDAVDALCTGVAVADGIACFETALQKSF
mmetsp:Transcript_44064/g.115805  ORF Transcript_44064/g.115805 Transcript_44064/m.115805 type:complete len:86 (-) Transcript_44064:1271-1528(-)